MEAVEYPRYCAAEARGLRDCRRGMGLGDLGVERSKVGRVPPLGLVARILPLDRRLPYDRLMARGYLMRVILQPP